MAKQRSPNYPGLNLEDAIERVTRIYRAEHKHAAAQIAVINDLGYTSVSGRALAQLGALRAYGLLEGRGDEIRVTDRAVAIIEFADEPSNAARIQALRECAFSPIIFKEMFDQFGDQPPSDAAMRHWLVAKDFLSKAADEVIHSYRENLAFLEASDVGYNEPHEANSNPVAKDEVPEIKVGDFVHWGPKGLFHTTEPKQIKGFSNDGRWAFIAGSPHGVLVKELTLEPKVGATLEMPPGLKGKAVAPAPPSPFPVSSADRRDVFSLAEGTVTIQWPAELSPESFEDFAAWLDILKRKIGRSVKDQRPINIGDLAMYADPDKKES